MAFSRKFCVAPMMNYTDRHCRYLLRMISKRALLYTEMITTDALLSGNYQRFLNFSADESPLALQLGGNDPDKLSRATELAINHGYSEINLNVGCPSSRVQQGGIGACLMNNPQLVGQCVQAIKKVVNLPVTIKHRIGITYTKNCDFCYDNLKKFILEVASYGCRTFIVHARLAMLTGLSPKENRNIPPLNYEGVYRLKQDFKELEIILNGGIKSLAEAQYHLQFVDGVMLGRAVCANPMLLSTVDKVIYNVSSAKLSCLEIAKKMEIYIENQLYKGVNLHKITRHMHGLFHGFCGAKKLRKILGELRINSNMDSYRQFLHYLQMAEI